MWESEQKFFQKFILKKNFGGKLKFSIFDENSHFWSIQHSRLTLKELQLQTPSTIPTFGQHRVKIPTEKFIKIFVYMWNSDRGEFKFKIQNFFLKFWVIILLFTRDMILIVIVDLISYGSSVSRASGCNLEFCLSTRFESHSCLKFFSFLSIKLIIFLHNFLAKTRITVAYLIKFNSEATIHLAMKTIKSAHP